MRIAILYLMTGVGHFRESLCLSDLLSKKGYYVELIDLERKLKYSCGFSGKFIIFVYSFILNSATVIEKKIPSVGSKPLNQQITFPVLLMDQIFSFSKLMEKFIGKVLSKRLNFKSYDHIVSTHPIATGVTIGAVDDINKIINICSDEVGVLTASFYKFPNVTTLVNSKFTRKSFIKIGAPANLVKIIGHLLDPKLYINRQKIYQRIQNDLSSQNLCLGLFIGWYAPKSQKEGIIQTIEELADYVKSGQIKLNILTGGHKDFERQLRKTLLRLQIQNHIKIAYTESAKELIRTGHDWIMNEVDILFSRPSELVFYSIATGMPHILFPYLGPQELDMLNLLRKYADLKEYKQVRKRLKAYVDDRKNLLKISRSLHNNGYKLNGVFEVASLIDSRKDMVAIKTV